MTEIIANSIDFLLQSRLVEEFSQVEGNEKNSETIWTFECIIQIPFPNSQALPERIRLRIELNEHYPNSEVKCFSMTEELRGFPHQDAKNHKICLKEEWRAPTNEKKLAKYITWVKEWITDAAMNSLVTSSDPYELPDFSILGNNPKLITQKQFFFVEDNNTFIHWKKFIGKNGLVTGFTPSSMNSLLITNFFFEGKEIHKVEYATALYDSSRIISGVWQLLPAICFINHRPPQTFGELRSFLDRNNVQLDQLLKSAWELDNQYPRVSFILIGFPIPKFFYSDPVEIHWIPILISNQKTDKKLNVRVKKKQRLWERIKLQNFGNHSPILWGESVNINPDRQFIRGKLQNTLAQSSVSLFGCGALGSQVADYLVRGGVQNISLYDNDVLLMGNLSRHTLDGSGCGLPKVELLKERLCRISPLSSVSSFYCKIPIGAANFKLIETIIKTDLLIDCTTDHNAFVWLNCQAENFKKRLVSIFFNFDTNLCTILVSGKRKSCMDVYCDLIDKVNRGQTKLDPNEYFRTPSKEEQIIEGVGCWHSTFPGKGFHIGLLISSAFDILENHFNNETGLGAVIKRNQYSEYTTDKNMLELLFFKNDYE